MQPRSYALMQLAGWQLLHIAATRPQQLLLQYMRIATILLYSCKYATTILCYSVAIECETTQLYSNALMTPCRYDTMQLCMYDTMQLRHHAASSYAAMQL
jgi:hypothetical protein